MGNKILLIGYSIFSRFQLNPAEEIVTILNGSILNGYYVKGIVLPVSYDYVKEFLPQLLRREDPDIVLGIGLAPNASKPVIELAASNVASFRSADIDGKKVRYELLEGNDILVIRTSLPVGKILEECSRQGLDIGVGMSIGTYLCGMAGYYIMKYALDARRLGGFMHIPPSTDLAMRHGLRNHAPLHELVETTKCVLEASSSWALQVLQQSSR